MKFFQYRSKVAEFFFAYKKMENRKEKEKHVIEEKQLIKNEKEKHVIKEEQLIKKEEQLIKKEEHVIKKEKHEETIESNVEENKIYICDLCGRTFTKHNPYWYHINKSKKLCVPKDKVLKELKNQKGQVIHYKVEVETLEEEIERLKKQLEFIQDITQKQNSNVTYNIDLSNVNNNLNINNINQIDIDNLIQVKLNKINEERLDHIPPELFLEILKCESVDKSVTQIIRSIYFNPKAPENYTWCVNDKKAKYGTLEYNHETKCLYAVDTNVTIEQNVHNVIPKVLDIMSEINKKVPFNKVQNENFHGLYGLYGTIQLESSTINDIKNMAYEDRDLPRVIWKQLCLDILKQQNTHEIKHI